MREGELKGGSLEEATKCAEGSRSKPAGVYNGGKPPSGPKKEPTKVNGVPLVRERGISK